MELLNRVDSLHLLIGSRRMSTSLISILEKKANVARVALYLRSKTRPGTEGSFQGIVISLKDVFYEKADALVGVCREPQFGASSTLTFDLEQFGPPIGAS